MGRKKQIDTSMYFCPHEDCANYGKVGTDNQIIGAGTYGKQHTQLLECKVCGRKFSARRGTPLFDVKAPDCAIITEKCGCRLGTTISGAMQSAIRSLVGVTPGCLVTTSAVVL